jgi:pSer/pThr/pTyr-binding forkhead associated (FHA) protein
MATITLLFNSKVLHRFSIKSGQTLTIGRRNDNRISIDNMSVSGYHAEIVSKEDAFVIRDLKSKNGTFVNQKLIASPYRLSQDDVITIGKHELSFSLKDERVDAVSKSAAGGESPHEKTRFLDTNTHRELLEQFASTAHKAPLLTLQFKGKTIRKYILKSHKPLTIGRTHGNDVVIDNTAVSGKHATIAFEDNEFVLRDLNSTNGVFVNERPVGKAPLNDGDVIRIGKHDLVFSIMGDFEPYEIGNDPKTGPAYFQSDRTTSLETKG